mmetsp:Transcript_36519/g.79031  ORF Transcript_36519/g.79031 Transcript_36519/m.79031 type:complete len:353 (-) Transcript_36519:1048-2106(-)
MAHFECVSLRDGANGCRADAVAPSFLLHAGLLFHLNLLLTNLQEIRMVEVSIVGHFVKLQQASLRHRAVGVARADMAFAINVQNGLQGGEGILASLEAIHRLYASAVGRVADCQTEFTCTWFGGGSRFRGTSWQHRGNLRSWSGGNSGWLLRCGGTWSRSGWCPRCGGAWSRSGWSLRGGVWSCSGWGWHPVHGGCYHSRDVHDTACGEFALQVAFWHRCLQDQLERLHRGEVSEVAEQQTDSSGNMRCCHRCSRKDFVRRAGVVFCIEGKSAGNRDAWGGDVDGCQTIVGVSGQGILLADRCHTDDVRRGMSARAGEEVLRRVDVLTVIAGGCHHNVTGIVQRVQSVAKGL